MSNFAIQIPADPGYHNRFGFPYKTTLSFVPYLNWLQQTVKDKNTSETLVLRHVLKTVKKCPELWLPIEDLSLLEKYDSEVRLLLSTILPASLRDDLIAGVIIPFQPITIYSTHKFSALVGDRGHGTWDFSKMNPINIMNQIVAFAGSAILQKYYEFNINPPDHMKSREMDKLSGSQMIYKPEINPRFVDIKLLKKPRSLNDIDLNPLKENFFDTEFWLKNFPADTFSFEGLTIYRMIDITDHELVSQLEYTLLQASSAISDELMKSLQGTLRSYFRVPDLTLGIIPVVKNQGHMSGCTEDNWCCLLPYHKKDMLSTEFEGSVYHQAMLHKGPVFIDDLTQLEKPTGLDKALLDEGYRNVVLVPIYKEGELIGMLELASGEPHVFNFLSSLKLKEILPLIKMAFERANEEWDNRIQATMKEYFTAIHPVVEWKFVDAAMQVISADNDQKQKKLPAIQFDDVVPIYGQIDVRGSSDRRNEAIRLDMIDYLNVANSILRESFTKYPLPILEELQFRTEKHLEKLRLSLDSGDETGILDFMSQEVEPAFRIIAARDASLRKSVDNFIASLMPHHEFYHMRRKDFEQSLTLINDTVALMMESEEEKTQKLLPHYFEKYKTDGVEYNIYLGQSLLQNGTFDPIYVKSFRLWQLMSMVNIARETKKLKSVLAVPLETTQLILCYNNPFSIMFRMDEKRFDVAGAYNIRYEIVKKRIDKAHIKGTNERITQPGTIAIIYTQDKEAREYARYFEYLEAKGYIQPDIEYLEVEQLQGMLGLKTLRVKVNYNEEEPKLQWDEEELFKQIKDVMV